GVPCAGNSTDCPTTDPNSTGVLPNFSSDPARNNGSGYDLATGLGSVNALNLFLKWSTATLRSTNTAIEIVSPASGFMSFTQPATLKATVSVPFGAWGPPLTGQSVTFSDVTTPVQLGSATLSLDPSSNNYVAMFSTSSLPV